MNLNFSITFDCTMIINKFKSLLEWNQWFIAYNFHNKEGKIDFTKFKTLIPSPDTFWADPFLFNYKNKNYIFFEEYDYVSTKGHISCFEVDKNGNQIYFPKILCEDFHLAYPQVFRNGENIFMIPDSRNGVNLYSCRRFPDKWSFEKKILDIACSDSTIFQSNQKFWLFTNTYSSKSGINNKLTIFHSNSLDENFIQYKGKIVVDNMFNSRSAGSIFKVGNNFFRPTQENQRNYGEAINLNLIKSIGSKRYEEKFIGRIKPIWMTNIDRTHTFNYSKSMSVIDGRIRRVNWKRIFHWRKILSKSDIYAKIVNK